MGNFLYLYVSMLNFWGVHDRKIQRTWQRNRRPIWWSPSLSPVSKTDTFKFQFILLKSHSFLNPKLGDFSSPLKHKTTNYIHGIFHHPNIISIPHSKITTNQGWVLNHSLPPCVCTSVFMTASPPLWFANVWVIITWTSCSRRLRCGLIHPGLRKFQFV